MRNNDIDYEEIYTLFGYEDAIKFLIAQAEDELRSKQDLKIVLVRFHIKASRLRRLEDSDKRQMGKKVAKDGKEDEDQD